jgi:large subunit ribosomal protein L9
VATNVKVLLQSDVPALGTGGEVVRVRAGFARNYLLPRGLALPATAGNLTQVEDLKKKAALRAKEERAEAEKAKEKLSAISITISRQVGQEGKMYGSVTARDIADAYERAGALIDRKRITLIEPIKQLGTFEVPAKLHADVVVTLKVEVVKNPG